MVEGRIRFAHRVLGAIPLCILATISFCQEVVLAVPSKGIIGQNVVVEFEGETRPGDFVAIATAQAPASAFLGYARVDTSDALEIQLPEDPGTYVVRFVSPSRGLTVVAETSIAVDLAPVPLFVPSEATVGETLTISVGDTGASADFVTIVPEGAEGAAIGPYARLRGKTEVDLVLNIEPGPYEIRHIRAAGLEIIARAPLLVKANATAVPPKETETALAVTRKDVPAEQPTEAANVSADLGGNAVLPTGEGIARPEVSGKVAAPGNSRDMADMLQSQQDFVAESLNELIAGVAGQSGGGRDRSDLAAAMEAAKGVLESLNSEAASQAMAMMQSSASDALGVTERKVSLVALAAVDPGAQFHVFLDGASRPGDRIGIHPVDGVAGGISGTVVLNQSKVLIEAPRTPGRYEIVYLDALSAKTLARHELEVRRP